MYSYEERMRAVELYIKLGKRLGTTIRELGCRCEGYRAGNTQLTVAILSSPDRQQRPAHAMPPRRRCHLSVANRTFLDDPPLILIRPLPSANAIGCRENFNLRAVNEIGHKVGPGAKFVPDPGLALGDASTSGSCRA